MRTFTRTLGAVLITAAVSPVAHATLTFDLRAADIELIDEAASFDVTVGGLTATLSANVGVLNRTSSSFGINIVGTTCGGQEDSAEIDDGCSAELSIPDEAVSVQFDMDVLLEQLKVSSFGSSDEALVEIFGASDIPITSTGFHSLNDTFLAAGNPFTIGFIAGNGFSFDQFTVAKAASEPGTLVLLGLALAGVGFARRRLH